MASVRTLAAAVALFAALNLLAGLADARYTPEALRTPVLGAEDPEILILAGSYGKVGLQLDELPAGTATWSCEGTSVSTWERLQLPEVDTLVLVLSPAAHRSPGVFTDLPLRRLYGWSDLPWLLELGEVRDAAELVASRLSPLYRMRQGLRRGVAAPVHGVRGLPRAHAGLPAPVAAPWSDWIADRVEAAALERLSRHPDLLVAEWPLSARLDVHDALREHFRPALGAEAERLGFTFLPLPDDSRYPLVDGIHPSPAEGRRWSRWLAGALRAREPR